MTTATSMQRIANLRDQKRLAEMDLNFIINVGTVYSGKITYLANIIHYQDMAIEYLSHRGSATRLLMSQYVAQ